MSSPAGLTSGVSHDTSGSMRMGIRSRVEELAWRVLPGSRPLFGPRQRLATWLFALAGRLASPSACAMAHDERDDDRGREAEDRGPDR